MTSQSLSHRFCRAGYAPGIFYPYVFSLHPFKDFTDRIISDCAFRAATLCSLQSTVPLTNDQSNLSPHNSLTSPHCSSFHPIKSCLGPCKQSTTSHSTLGLNSTTVKRPSATLMLPHRGSFPLSSPLMPSLVPSQVGRFKQQSSFLQLMLQQGDGMTNMPPPIYVTP